jgi:PAS domain S-box-containing protein
MSESNEPSSHVHPRDKSVIAGRLQGLDFWLVDSLVVPASLHDAAGRFVHMNAAAERASGSSNAHMIGRHFTEPLLPQARRNVEALFRRSVERGEPADFETVFVDASGQVRGVRAQHLPLRCRDETVGVLILAYAVYHPQSKPVGADPSPRLTGRVAEPPGHDTGP